MTSDRDAAAFLDDVRALLVRTKTNDITLAEFERRFLALHAEMPLRTPETSAAAIEALFWSVEAFVAEPSLRSDSDLDEQVLGDAIDICLSELDAAAQREGAALEHFIGAYFHQDWNHVYSSREEAVADFVRRSPDRAPAVPGEIDELLRASDDDVAERLEGMGFDDAPPDGDRAFLIELRAHLARRGEPS